MAQQEKRVLYVICSYCGKITKGGRLPVKGNNKGDGSERYPRRHKNGNSDCPGNIEFGRWQEYTIKSA